MAALRSNMAAMAQMSAQGFIGSSLALVTSYDPDHYAVKVKLQPPPAEGDATETGWMPIWSGWIGNGWGLFCPPVIGAQVKVHFVAGDDQVGLCVGGIFSDADQPLAVPSGEFWIVHKSGAFFKLTNDGKLMLDDAHGAHIILNGDGTVSSAGTWKHTGSLEVTGAAKFDGAVEIDGKTTAAEIDATVVKIAGVTVVAP